MADSSRFVLTNINTSALIPQAVPSDFPLLISTDGQQSLTKLFPQYLSNGDALQTYYKAHNMNVAHTLDTMFSQTVSVGIVGGLDLETEYTITFAADGSLNYNIEWLNGDGASYTTFSGTAANIAALVTFINANISTVTASSTGLVFTLVTKVDTANQLVRISFSNLTLDKYTFAATNVPASVGTIIAALMTSSANFQFINYYCLIVESNLFYPTVLDSNSSKITAQTSLANAIEATQNAGDNRKVLAISSQDPSILLSDSTTDIMYIVKNLALKRTKVDYYPLNNMTSGVISGIFGLNDGNADEAYYTVTGIAAQYLTEAQLNVIYLLDNEGNLSPNCKNGNYYVNSAGRSFYYPGISGSALPFDVTILMDHIAKDCRYAQINLLNTRANSGDDVPYNQEGINQMTGVIRGVVNQYLYNGYLTPVDTLGSSCVINAPTFAQIQANPALQNQFKNRVLTGITISVIPAGGINKTIETFVVVI